jgi:anti-sigma B factor antagonist
VSLFKRTRAYGGSFEITGLNGQPKSIFELLRLDRVFGL